MIAPFEPTKHLSVLGKWLKARGQAGDAGSPEFYPPTGFVVDDCVVGFLYATDAKRVGYLDGFVADPDVKGERRSAAFDRLITSLVDAAKQMGITNLFAFTPHISLIRGGLKHDFFAYGEGYTCLARIESKSCLR